MKLKNIVSVIASPAIAKGSSSSSTAKARDAVHVVFAGTKVRADYVELVPEIDQYELMEDARTLPFDRLVMMKLTSNRDKDRVHIRDLISIGLIDASWLDRFPPQLRARLQDLLDDPNG